MVEPRFARRIAETIPAGASVVEIGGGTGTLTAALAQRATSVVTIEVDTGLAQLLRERFGQGPTSLVPPQGWEPATLGPPQGSEPAPLGQLQVLEADALEVDFGALLDRLRAPRAICGNLPYNITTPLIERILEVLPRVESATLMVQREYARRLVATPGCKDYSSLSVFAAYHAHCASLFDVGAAGFYPAPAVASTVVRLSARPRPLDGDAQARFLRFVRAAFAQRRKTLANSASSAFAPHDRTAARALFERALTTLGLARTIRTEALDLPRLLAIFGEFESHAPERWARLSP